MGPSTRCAMRHQCPHLIASFYVSAPGIVEWEPRHLRVRPGNSTPTSGLFGRCQCRHRHVGRAAQLRCGRCVPGPAGRSRRRSCGTGTAVMVDARSACRPCGDERRAPTRLVARSRPSRSARGCSLPDCVCLRSSRAVHADNRNGPRHWLVRPLTRRGVGLLGSRLEFESRSGEDTQPSPERRTVVTAQAPEPKPASA